LVIHPKVAGDEGQKGNPLDHPLVLAAPVMRHQRHPPGIGLIQGRVKRPFRKSTKAFASCHNAYVSEGFLESSLVKASWAGAFSPSG